MKLRIVFEVIWPVLGPVLTAVLVGCGHTLTHQVGLASFGDLRGVELPPVVPGPTLTGQDCGVLLGADRYSLANAVQNAVEGTSFDTLVDLQVTNATSFFIFGNCIRVSGVGVDSRTLKGDSR